MTDQHPITPPPELVQQWMGEFFGCTVNGELSDSERYLATQAARWGADQELEACCELLKQKGVPAWSLLRLHRRPKPKSLREQALEALDSASYQPGSDFKQIDPARSTVIRRALEQLDH